MEQGEFSEASGQALESCPERGEADSMLRGILAEEGERVSQAVAFAEILVPMLAERLSGTEPAAARRSPGAPRARRAGAGMPGETPGIADFIDEMLAQARPGAR